MGSDGARAVLSRHAEDGHFSLGSRVGTRRDSASHKESGWQGKKTAKEKKQKYSASTRSRLDQVWLWFLQRRIDCCASFNDTSVEWFFLLLRDGHCSFFFSFR